MFTGIVLGKKIWDADVAYSKFWNPKKYGVDIKKVFLDTKELLKMKSAEGFDFLIATDLWSIPVRKGLEHARELGLKIFFLPREPFCFFEEYLFKDKRFLHKNKYYFTPDVVLATGTMYEKYWEDKTKVYVTGHPRFDYCLYDNWVDKSDVCNEFGLDPNKKILFYPSTTIFTSKNLDKDMGIKNWDKLYADVFLERESLLEALVEISKRKDTQVIVKIHPMSSAVFRKNGVTKDIEGVTLKYLKNPTEDFKVIDGKSKTRKVARDLLTTCDFVVSSNSTMMVEALMLKKPVLRALMGISNSILLYKGYDDVFECANGFNDVVCKINNMLDSGKVNTNTKDLEKYMLMDGRSCEHICNTIKKECST